MYKNQLQELAQRSCFNMPSYVCVREGPDHAPRFKASVNFNGEIFHGPNNCTTLRQAEHSAAEVALANLSSRAPSRSLAALVLDETGVYKNLLQETTHRAGLKLPVYTTVRSGPGHQPVFTSTVELANMSFTGEPAKTKKQAEKNAAMATWSALKKMPDLESSPRPRDVVEGGRVGGEEHEQVVRVLSCLKPMAESKQARQREHQLLLPQGQKKALLAYNEGASSSASRHPSPWFQHQRRSFEHKQSTLLHPLFSSGTNVRSPLPPNSCVPSQKLFFSKDKCGSPLRLPSPQPISYLLGSGSSQARPEIKHLNGRRDDKRMHETSIFQEKASPFASRQCGPPRLNLSIAAPPASNSPTIRVPKAMSTGGHHNLGIAPAVQIRSVTRVCAAPPIHPPQQSPPQRLTDDRSGLFRESATNGISAAASQLSNLQL